MRIAPHVLYLLGAPDTMARKRELIGRVVADGVTTHGHPRALVGALAYASALDFVVNTDETIEYGALVRGARQGLISSNHARELLPAGWHAIQKTDEFERLWDETIAEMEELLNKVEASLELGAMSSAQETLRSLGVTDPKIGGAGTITAAAAIFLASRSAPKPMSALVSSAFQPEADTDTLASMVGGLLGGIHGQSWLSELEPLQDREYAADLSASLVSKRVTPRRVESGQVKERSDALLKQLDAGDVQTGGVFPDGRKYSVESTHQLEGQPYRRFRLRLEDNQTVIIDRKSISGSNLAHNPDQLNESQRGVSDGNSTPRTAPLNDEGTLTHSTSVSVTLPTHDVYRISDFYSRLLGYELAVYDGNLRLSGHVFFRQAKSERVKDNISAALDLQMTDLAGAAGVLGEPIRGTEPNHYVIGKDPDGRPVRIHQ